MIFKFVVAPSLRFKLRVSGSCVVGRLLHRLSVYDCYYDQGHLGIIMFIVGSFMLVAAVVVVGSIDSSSCGVDAPLPPVLLVSYSLFVVVIMVMIVLIVVYVKRC